MATTSARRNRAVWDRPATDTHLLLWLQPIPVFLGNPLDPLRKSIVASAPSRPPFPQRHRAADARVPSPRMITHGSYPQRACPTTVDARVLSRMISCSASPWRRSGCLRLYVADDFPLRPPRRRSGCLRLYVADDFPLRPPRRRSGCLRLYVADDFPLRPPRRRSGCLRLCVADDFPLRPPRRRSGCLR